MLCVLCSSTNGTIASFSFELFSKFIQKIIGYSVHILRTLYIQRSRSWNLGTSTCLLWAQCPPLSKTEKLIQIQTINFLNFPAYLSLASPWLPVKDRIIFKLLLIRYKSLNRLALVCIKELLHHYTPCRSLRSSVSNLLVIPRPLQLPTVIDLLWKLLRSYEIS